MRIVAITRLNGPVEHEAVALALDLDSAPYDERLNLNSGPPIVVLATADTERARALSEQIRKRGHDSIVCDGDKMVAGDKMISLRRFDLDERGLVDPEREGRPRASLPFSEIAVLVRANQQSTMETKSVVKDKKFDVGRAVLSGGLLLSKTTTRNVTTVRHQSEDVLYLFRRDGRTPWILHANGTHYSALGEQLAPTARANFLILVSLLRERARGAAYDESLLAFRKVPERARRAAVATRALASSDDGGNDLLAHVVAASLCPLPWLV